MFKCSDRGSEASHQMVAFVFVDGVERNAPNWWLLQNHDDGRTQLQNGAAAIFLGKFSGGGADWRHCCTYLTSSLGVIRTKSFINNSGSEYFGVELLNTSTIASYKRHKHMAVVDDYD